MFSLDLEACGTLSEGFCFALLPRIWRTFAKRSGEHEFGKNDYSGESNTGVEYLPVLSHSHDLAKFDGTLISNSDYFHILHMLVQMDLPRPRPPSLVLWDRRGGLSV